EPLNTVAVCFDIIVVPDVRVFDEKIVPAALNAVLAQFILSIVADLEIAKLQVVRLTPSGAHARHSVPQPDAILGHAVNGNEALTRVRSTFADAHGGHTAAAVDYDSRVICVRPSCRSAVLRTGCALERQRLARRTALGDIQRTVRPSSYVDRIARIERPEVDAARGVPCVYPIGAVIAARGAAANVKRCRRTHGDE